MKNPKVLLSISGMIAGICLVLLCRAVPALLVFGVGSVIIGALVWSLFSLGIRISKVRALAAVLLGIPIYFLSFLVFVVTENYVQHHGGPVSGLSPDMKADDVLGLVAAVAVASIGLEFIALLLSKIWSTLAVFKLLGGGIVSVALTYGADVVYARLSGNPESFLHTVVYFGPLLIVGGAFTNRVLGEQVIQAASSEGGLGYMRSNTDALRQ